MHKENRRIHVPRTHDAQEARILAPSLGRVTQHSWAPRTPWPARYRAAARVPKGPGALLAGPGRPRAGTTPLARHPQTEPLGVSQPVGPLLCGRLGAEGAVGEAPPRGRPGPALTLQQSGDETVHVQLPVRHFVGTKHSFPAAGTRASRRRRLRRRLGVLSPTSHAAFRPRF